MKVNGVVGVISDVVVGMNRSVERVSVVRRIVVLVLVAKLVMRIINV